jgi:hypothetical protein
MPWRPSHRAGPYPSSAPRSSGRRTHFLRFVFVLPNRPEDERRPFLVSSSTSSPPTADGATRARNGAARFSGKGNPSRGSLARLRRSAQHESNNLPNTKIEGRLEGRQAGTQAGGRARRSKG